MTRVCQYGVMAGSSDKFSPDQVVTKAEFVAMLIRLFD
ncbi:S-layer homology domain-containing protein [bacterium]|nr:S-layer homology domain-containing protein [bacterium]